MEKASGTKIKNRKSLVAEEDVASDGFGGQ
jgi:hypothetical protein